MNDLDWKMPALVGGLITGVFSLVPVVNLANCCFCGWALFGGAIAAKMLINRTPRQVTSGDGAKIGLMAGLIAAVIYLFISAPLVLSGAFEGFQSQLLARLAELSNDPSLQEMAQRAIEENQNRSAIQKFIGSFVVLVPLSFLLGAFCVLGGLLGVALFEKRKGLPPSPPQYPPSVTPTYPPQYPPQSGGE
jgi:hypothetical protein